MLSVLTAAVATLALAMTWTMTGIFAAFSLAVMPGLDATEAARAIPAMQRINQKILNPLFLATFTLAPVTAALTGSLLLWSGPTAAGVVFLLAAAAYVLGAFLPTAVVNVPLNQALDVLAVPVDPDEAARRWSDYSTRWTRWNTLRALASLTSLLLVGLGLFLWGRQG